MQAQSDQETPSTQAARDNQGVPAKCSGRTFWDVLHAGRFVLLVILVIAGIASGAYYAVTSGTIGTEEIIPAASYAVGQSYPAVLFFAAGFLLMRHILFNLYRPVSRYVFVTNADDQVCGLFRIPEPRFQSMNQPGNPLVFKTVSGTLIYFARYLDIENNEIGYGWCHVDKWEIVSADRVLFSKIEKDFRWLLERVMYLEGHLEVEAAYKARSPMNKMVEDIASRFGLRDRREYFGFDHSNESVSENDKPGERRSDENGGIQ